MATIAKSVRFISIWLLLLSSQFTTANIIGEVNILFESDSVKVLLSQDISDLRLSEMHIKNITKYLTNERAVRRFFFQNTSGKEHIIASIVREVIQDSKLTEILVDSLMNVTNTYARVRVKRAWAPFLGNILNKVTGVAGPNQVKLYKKAFEQLKDTATAQSHFNSQIIHGQKIQHTILSRTNKLLLNITEAMEHNMIRISANKKNSEAAVNLLSLLTMANVINKNTRSIVNRADKIISFGSIGYLTTAALPRSTLSNVISSIQMSHPHYAPLFGASEVENYYNTKLTSCHFNGTMIHTSLHVPLIQQDDIFKLRPLKKQEKELSHFDLYSLEFIAVNDNKGSYSLLSHEDLNSMLKVKGNYIAQRRRAEILTHKSLCTEISCREVVRIGDYILQYIDETSFLLKLRKIPVVANLECQNETAKSITLNKTEMLLTLPPDCSFKSRHFKIAESSSSNSHILRERNIKFEIKLQNPRLKDLTNEGNETSSQLGWRGVIKSNIKDLRGLKKSNGKLSEMNAFIKDKIGKITLAGMIGGGSIGLVILVIVLCCICIIFKNRSNLTIPCFGRRV